MPRRNLPAALQAASHRRRRNAFTLTELLVVIGIIILLMSILIPVVSRMRGIAQNADTSALIRAIDSAVQTYYSDHQAWPGPIPDALLGPGIDTQIPVIGRVGNVYAVNPPPATDNYFRHGGTLHNVTGTENLVLALMGGLLRVQTQAGGPADLLGFDPAAVGRGPVRLGGRTPGGYSPYLDLPPGSLSTHAIGDSDITYAGVSEGDRGRLIGRYVDDITAARDSIIPEFVDRYSNPLPILYMRASSVGRITPDRVGATQGRVIATNRPPGPREEPGVYNQLHIDGYVGPTGVGAGSIGIGKEAIRYYANGQQLGSQQVLYHGLRVFDGSGNAGGINLNVPNNDTAPDYLRRTMQLGEAEFTLPYDVRAYLLDPGAVAPRQADRYVIISAGPDRIFGTDDDITSFGAVRQ